MHVECDVAISVIKQLFNAVRSPRLQHTVVVCSLCYLCTVMHAVHVGMCT